MDQIMNKVGSYWLGQKANKEFNSVGDDFNVFYHFPFFTYLQDFAFKVLVSSFRGKASVFH